MYHPDTVSFNRCQCGVHARNELITALRPHTALARGTRLACRPIPTGMGLASLVLSRDTSKGDLSCQAERRCDGEPHCFRDGLRCSTGNGGGDDGRRLEIHCQWQRECPLHRFELRGRNDAGSRRGARLPWRRRRRPHFVHQQWLASRRTGPRRLDDAKRLRHCRDFRLLSRDQHQRWSVLAPLAEKVGARDPGDRPDEKVAADAIDLVLFGTEQQVEDHIGRAGR